MLAVIELEIFSPEDRRIAFLAVEKEMIYNCCEGYFLIINDQWERVQQIIQDLDHGKCFIRLDRKTVKKDEIDHAVRSYTMNGWRLIKEKEE